VDAVLLAQLAQAASEYFAFGWRTRRHAHTFRLRLRACELIVSYKSTRHSTMLEPDLISRIRHIFLTPTAACQHYAGDGLLGWSRRQMSEAIENGGSSCGPTPLGKWFRGRR